MKISIDGIRESEKSLSLLAALETNLRASGAILSELLEEFQNGRRPNEAEGEAIGCLCDASRAAPNALTGLSGALDEISRATADLNLYVSGINGRLKDLGYRFDGPPDEWARQFKKGGLETRIVFKNETDGNGNYVGHVMAWDTKHIWDCSAGCMVDAEIRDQDPNALLDRMESMAKKVALVFNKD